MTVAPTLALEARRSSARRCCGCGGRRWSALVVGALRRVRAARMPCRRWRSPARPGSSSARWPRSSSASGCSACRCATAWRGWRGLRLSVFGRHARPCRAGRHRGRHRRHVAGHRARGRCCSPARAWTRPATPGRSTACATQDGPNYAERVATIRVAKNGVPVVTLQPSRRTFPVQRMTTTEAAIHTNFLRDLYAVLGRGAGRRRRAAAALQSAGALDLARGAGDGDGRRAVLAGPAAAGRRAGARRAAPGLGGRVNRRRRPAAGAARRRRRRRRRVLGRCSPACARGVFDPHDVPSQLIGQPRAALRRAARRWRRPTGFGSADLARAGRPVLVNFFASWCVPCVIEAPALMALKQRGRADLGHRLQGQAGRHPHLPRPQRQPLCPHRARRRPAGSRSIGASTACRRPTCSTAQGVVRWRQAGPLTPEIIDATAAPCAPERRVRLLLAPAAAGGPGLGDQRPGGDAAQSGAGGPRRGGRQAAPLPRLPEREHRGQRRRPRARPARPRPPAHRRRRHRPAGAGLGGRPLRRFRPPAPAVHADDRALWGSPLLAVAAGLGLRLPCPPPATAGRRHR